MFRFYSLRICELKTAKPIDMLGQNVEDIFAKVFAPFREGFSSCLLRKDIVKIFNATNFTNGNSKYCWYVPTFPVRLHIVAQQQIKREKQFFFILSYLYTLQTTLTKNWNNFWMENSFRSNICLGTTLVSCFLFVFLTKYQAPSHETPTYKVSRTDFVSTVNSNLRFH